jgi:ABC-type multidrug transport system fused ATPase/permease subunit
MVPNGKKINASSPAKKDKKELLLSFKRLYSFLNFDEKIKIALGMTALSVNAITNLSFPYILGQVILLKLFWLPDFTINLSYACICLQPLTTVQLIFKKALDHSQTLDVTSSMGLFMSGSSKFLLQSAAFFLVGSISSWVRVYYLGTATESIASRMRVILFSSCMDKDMEFFQVEKNGELISVMEKGFYLHWLKLLNPW